MNENLIAALLRVNADTAQLRGFGASDVDAMRDAIESGRITWQAEEGATWAEITRDAKRAEILTFVSTPYGVLVLDEN